MAVDSIKLFIAPLNKSIDDEMLRDRFKMYGDLFSAEVATDEFGESKGFGFVHFMSVEDGLIAMEKTNEALWMGKKINVHIANHQETRCFGAKASIWANEFDNPLEERESSYDASSDTSETTDEQSTSDIKERMKKLFETESYTDVTFFSGYNSKVTISAHRAVLAVGSPLFRKMLFGDGNEDTAGRKMEVEISNVSFEAFTNIVKFLYTDEVFFESDAQVQDILQVAKEFDIPSLVSNCKTHFETLPLMPENVCSKLQISISNKIGVLKERCIEFIQGNTLKVINSSDFLNCNFCTVHAICKLPSLNLRNEFELLRAVMNWSKAEPVQSRKQAIQTLLKCFRFLTFTTEELANTLQDYPNLLTSDNGLKIMLYLYNPRSMPDLTSLPPWCSKNARSRCFFSERTRESTGGLNARSLNDPHVGKIELPLKTCNDQKTPSALTSCLQMTCIAGRHIIKAIKLSFQPVRLDLSEIRSLSVVVRVLPSGFRTAERIPVGWSDSVRVEFSKVIKARRGDVVDIEVEAKDVSFYRFLQFDESVNTLQNPHFQCSASSKPTEGRMYCISEVEYCLRENAVSFTRNERKPAKKP